MHDFSISVIIPVLGEQENINTCISHLRDILGPETEIIVSDGDPQGSTIEKVQDPSAVTIISPAGRAFQMNAAAAVAKGEILLFLHADTTLPEKTAEIVRKTFTLPSVTASAFALSFDDNHPLTKLTAFVGNIRTRVERVPYGDQAPFIRAKVFHSLGGFPEIPIMEDVEFFQKIKKKRELIVIHRESVQTSARRYHQTGIVKCFLRNWMLRLLHFSGIAPSKLARMYKPNKTK